LASIGSQLAAAREAKRLTVADVAARLHLRAMFVDAMERENWQPIGEPVYVRGFVRSYARLVGLDPEPLIGQLNVEYYPPPEPVPQDERSSRNGEAPPAAGDAYTFERHVRIERQSSFYPWLLGALSTVAALLVFMVVRVYFFAPAENVAQVPPVVSQAAGVNAGDSVAATPEANAIVAAADRGATSQSGVQLRLQLTQDCWLAVAVDGKRVLYETLPAGSVREFRAARTITLRAGNAGGVVATVDGQPLGTLGSRGQVQERVFAAKSVEPPVTGPRE
jgi:cytoskeleton protein RodZ